MISAEQLQSVGNWLAGQAGNVNFEQELRAAFPGVHFTFCLDDDVISDSPVTALPGFRLYLVDSSNHCLSLTNDPESASGLVVAEYEED